jgi:hypothetical protein
MNHWVEFFIVEERIVAGDKDHKYFCERDEGSARWRNDCNVFLLW